MSPLYSTMYRMLSCGQLQPLAKATMEAGKVTTLCLSAEFDSILRIFFVLPVAEQEA